MKELESQAQGDVTIDQVKAFFPEIPKDSQKFILTLFNNSENVVSFTFLHTWFVSDLSEDVVYHGSVLKLKTKRCAYVIAYYNAANESADDAVDETVTRSTLIVDALFGDLVPLV